MTTFETNALEINDLNKIYPGFSLNHLNLTLPSGCILVNITVRQSRQSGVARATCPD